MIHSFPVLLFLVDIYNLFSLAALFFFFFFQLYQRQGGNKELENWWEGSVAPINSVIVTILLIVLSSLRQWLKTHFSFRKTCTNSWKIEMFERNCAVSSVLFAIMHVFICFRPLINKSEGCKTWMSQSVPSEEADFSQFVDILFLGVAVLKLSGQETTKIQYNRIFFFLYEKPICL